VILEGRLMKARMQPAGALAARGPLALGLALIALASTGVARGDAIKPTYPYYRTQGWVEQPPTSANPDYNRQPIQFSPVSTNGALPQQQGSFSLGQFQVLRHDLGGSYTFTDMPFGIKLVLDDGNAATAFDPVILISGVLNGTVTGNAFSSMIASVTSIVADPWTAPPPFDLSRLKITAVTLNSPNVNGGWTELRATLIPPPPVPEPSSLLIMGSMTLAFGLWSRSRHARRDS
jgi:hypothetical protein